MAFEIDFLPVGSGTKSGDAICVRYGNGYNQATIHVIDGGYTETGPEIVEHIRTTYGNPDFIDHVVLTHPDTDHVSGLFHVIENFSVGTLWMHRPWLYASEIIHRFHGNWTVDGLTRHLKDQFATLVELEKLAISRGVSVASPLQGAEIGAFTVLAPERSRYLDIIVALPNTPAEVKSKKASALHAFDMLIERAKIAILKHVSEDWYNETLEEYPGATSPSNESSVVQATVLDGKKILLTGDVGPTGLQEAYDYASIRGFSQPDLMQVPHHGSRRNVTPSVLNCWLGGVVTEGYSHGYAVCSAAENDLDHPRAKVENAFLRRGYPVYSTKGQLKYYAEGVSRGYSYAQPAPFRTQVEE
ncbi:MBL fold metallo-hydrolase [Agrobacterium sp. lyk4-40-TYG-31]|uniref:ComEC/Rec2 family competence protein n=1 Tax=Agrobacterium sp. lyk4-40-TYG-31 TaxID=3040276 RepID=UPI00254C6E31|nr:MBL fold metallo-hydrolase [Agrobacterium sp. lyk4-40-TYG-31]